MQNFLPLRSLRRLVQSAQFSPVHRMLPALFLSFTFLLCLSLALDVRNVSAQVPTSTFRPMFPTGTPFMDTFGCPPIDVTPIGWGTVTPSAGWDYLCGRCVATGTPSGIPSTPVPTAIWADGATATSIALGTGTPVPTSTGTPIGVASVTPTPTYIAYPLTYISSSSSKSSYTANDEFLRMDVTCSVPAGSALPMRCDYFLRGTDSNSSVTAWVSWLVTIGDLNDPAKRYASYRWYSEIDDNWGNLVSVVAPVSGYAEGVKEVDNNTLFSARCLSSDQASYQGPFECSGYVLFCYDEAQCATFGQPTPTPFASPTYVPSYCGVVESDGDSGDEIDLPYPTIGDAECANFPGFTVPFSWFSLVGWDFPDLEVPNINICFAPVMFGTLGFLGYSIDLDILAGIIAGFFLVRLVLG